MIKYYSSVVMSHRGPIHLSWQWEETGNWKLSRIVLPSHTIPFYAPAPREPLVVTWEEKIARLLAGHEEKFNLEALDLTPLKPWQKQALLNCLSIPRGFVTSYNLLATACGINHGARAIGWAMAHNPFPLVIPCHRVVRADGTLGGYGGGGQWKKDLLLQEGVCFSRKGLIDKTCFISL